jgi:hypothetical protein
MDPQLMALAALAGQELVKAMAGDGWAAVRDAAARWFGRGDEQRAQRQGQELEETRTAVQTGTVAESVAAGRWQGRLEALLDEHPELADELTALVSDLQKASTTGAVSATDHALVIGGDAHIEGTHGGIGAGVIHGSVSAGYPSPPGPAQS